MTPSEHRMDLRTQPSPRGAPTHASATPELVQDARAVLGEGPAWDAAAAELLWVDILSRRVHRYRPEDGSDITIEMPSHVSAVAPRAGGGFILTLRDGFWLLDPGASVPRPYRLINTDQPGIRFNDGKVDAAGRFWAGTMAYDLTEGAAALYRLDPDGSLTTMLQGVTISNGITWTADGRTMYYIDTPTRRIDAFDADPASGAIGGRRTVVQLPDDVAGVPDGMTIDDEGGLWVALWDGWAVHRYLPDGTRDAIVPMPVARPSSCAFGGPDLSDLYITTARPGDLTEVPPDQPGAGGLFRVRPGVRGIRSTPFGG